MRSVLPASIPGIAAGAVIAAAAAASWLVTQRRLPHLAAGALAGFAAVLASRWSAQPVAMLVAAVVALTAAVGFVAAAVDGVLVARERDVRRLGVPPLLADVSVLGIVVGAAALARPSFAVQMPAGPLGGTPGVVPAIAAAVVGLAATAALLHPAIARLPVAARWALAGVLLALSAVPAAGLLNTGALDPSTIGVPSPVAAGVADAFGLGVRAVAVALAAGRSPARLAAWGLVMGIGEALLRRVDPALAILPVAAVLTVGISSRVATQSREQAA